ncbi:MAG: GYF domain-containing protein [Polyangiaceae bacterium]
MKFVCEQCKAKYQIADDRVAGKTVRMKCRKCGHLIEVRAAVTETSVAASSPPREGASTASTKPGPPGAPPTKTGGSAPPRPPPKPLATSLAAQRPQGQAQRPSAPPPRPQAPSAARTTGSSAKPEAGALAGAFQRSVTQEEKTETLPTDDRATDLLNISASDEWYAAINGVPVGPIRIAELRRKAAHGAVTEDSLVWQEGFEEWRPVRSYPELAAIVREAAASARPSLTPAPGEVRPSNPPGSMRPARPGATPPPRPAAPRPAMTPSPAAAAARSNVIPITSRLATAERLDENPTPMASPAADPLPAIDPFAVPATAASKDDAPIAPIIAAPVLAPGASVAAPAKAQPKQTNWQGIGFVVFMATAGGVGAYVALHKDPPPPAPVATVQTVYVPTPAAPPTAAPVTPPPADTATPAPSATTAPVAVAGTKPAAGGKTAPTPATSGGKPVVDLGGLLGGVAPTTGGPGAGPSGGGGSLTEDQINSVVSARRIAVKRQCWEKSDTQTSSVSVTATVTVGPQGQVQNVTSSGNEPTIGRCIETDIKKNWKFPPTGGVSTVAIPFKFVRQ